MATKTKDKSAKLNDAAKKGKSSAGNKRAQPKQTEEIGNVGPAGRTGNRQRGQPTGDSNRRNGLYMGRRPDVVSGQTADSSSRADAPDRHAGH